MKTIEELEKISEKIIEKIDKVVIEEEKEILLLSSDYASVSNIINNQSKQLKYLIYEDLKKEFKK